MLPITSANVPNFKSHNDEVEFWKNLALKLQQENLQLTQKTQGKDNNNNVETSINSQKLFDDSHISHENFASGTLCKHSLDPFDFTVLHEYVHALILQHLTGDDLLAMSKVSPKWNKFVETKIADKVKLKFSHETMNNDDIISLLESARNYKVISVKLGNYLEPGILMLLKDFEEISFENEDVYKLSNLPKLKKLNLNIGSRIWIGDIVLEGLEELTISGSDDDNKCNWPALYPSLLQNAKNLKRLDISGCKNWWNVYDYQFAKVSLHQLEFLKVAKHEDLRIFHQLDLENLTHLVCLSGFSGIENISDKFHTLTTLELEQCGEGSFTTEFQEHTSIKRLSLEFDFAKIKDPQRFISAVKNILQALPELESLFISCLTVELMEFIALNVKKLQKLECEEIQSGVMEKYKEMREKNEDVNRNIEFLETEKIQVGRHRKRKLNI